MNIIYRRPTVFLDVLVNEILKRADSQRALCVDINILCIITEDEVDLAAVFYVEIAEMLFHCREHIVRANTEYGAVYRL